MCSVLHYESEYVDGLSLMVSDRQMMMIGMLPLFMLEVRMSFVLWGFSGIEACSLVFCISFYAKFVDPFEPQNIFTCLRNDITDTFVIFLQNI